MILQDSPDRRPQTIGGGVYLVVVGVAVIGLVITLVGAWRTGVCWMGSGLLLSSVARLVLPERSAGMLRVRSRVEDVVMLALVGAALIFLALTIPNQR